MKRKKIEELINTGREIEFLYNNKKYSITYYGDNRSNYISFCEFNKEPIDVSSIDKLLDLTLDGSRLEEIFSNLPNESVEIY